VNPNASRTLKVIEKIFHNSREDVLIDVETILGPETAHSAILAGAEFILSHFVFDLSPWGEKQKEKVAKVGLFFTQEGTTSLGQMVYEVS